MRTVIRLARRLCLLGLSGVAVAAAQEAPSASIRQVVHSNRISPTYQQAVLGQAELFEAGLSTHCGAVTLQWAASKVFLTQAGRVLPDGKADGTQWVERVPGEACGQKRVYRVLVLLNDGKGQMQQMLPGDGWAGALLEHDTVLQVRAAIRAYTKQNCPVDVVNTTLTGGQPSPDAKAPWTETWTAHSCGKHLDVPITFVPDKVGSGTSMAVEASKIVALP